MSLASTSTVEIAGPEGPLQGTLVGVTGAQCIVVIVPGSGPTDRDGNSARTGLNSDSYRLLAEGLAASGVSSLRVDKRGMFGSSRAIADANAVTVGDYAEDARAWVAFAADHAPRVWLAGHSEGGLVALAAASATPSELAGLILLATAARPLDAVLLAQLEANPANEPLMPEMREIIQDLKAGRGRPNTAISEPLWSLFHEGIQGYLRDVFRYDPVKIAASWTGPMLVLQGDADIQVGPDHAKRFCDAVPHARHVMLAGATHMLKSDISDQPLATYRDPSLPLHARVIPAIVDMLG